MWYSLDLDSNDAFKELIRKHYPNEFRKCPEFLRHKTSVIEPGLLLKNGIKLHKIVQRPREFVIGRPQAYHSGFNTGYNIAEAVNFALEPWLELAKKGIDHCKC